MKFLLKKPPKNSLYFVLQQKKIHFKKNFSLKKNSPSKIISPSKKISLIKTQV